MAAPMNWFENPRNPRPRHQYFQQNQTGQSFQRIPQQHSSIQQFNPRYPPGSFQRRPVLRHEPPNFPTSNKMVQNIHENNYPYNQRNYDETFSRLNDIEQTHANMPTPSCDNFNNSGRFDHQLQSNLNNGPHFQDIHNKEWQQQMCAGQNEFQHRQSINNSNQLNRHNLAYQDDTTFLQQEKFQKESNSRAFEYNLAQEDQRWLQHWLQNRQQERNSVPENKPMKICEAQEKTRQMIVLLARLQKNKQILETVKHEDKSIWEQKLKEVLSLKNELDKVQKELTSEDNVRHLRAKVSERKKKRERIKQRKKELYEQNNEMLAIRERKHADVDKAMQQLIEKQKLEKQEKDMQKEADEILSQVRKKLTEANRSIQLIDGLQKLRKLRTDRLERQGVLNMYESQGHGSTNRLMFEAKLSNMRDLLNKQLEIYKAEEAALKVHLETEHEETREKEREKTRLRMIERQKQERKKEEKMLFGNQKEPVPGDPLYPFRQYYDAASHSIDSLIAIRRDWDSYLTSPGLGSGIPDSWVIPEEPSSESWGTALKQDQPT